MCLPQWPTYTLAVSMFRDVPSMVCVYAVENEMITCSSAEPWDHRIWLIVMWPLYFTLFSTGPPSDPSICWFLLKSELTLVLSSGRHARMCCINNWMSQLKIVQNKMVHHKIPCLEFWLDKWSHLWRPIWDNSSSETLPQILGQSLLAKIIVH